LPAGRAANALFLYYTGDGGEVSANKIDNSLPLIGFFIGGGFCYFKIVNGAADITVNDVANLCRKSGLALSGSAAVTPSGCRNTSLSLPLTWTMKANNRRTVTRSLPARQV